MGIKCGLGVLLNSFGNDAIRRDFPLRSLVDEGVTKVGIDATQWLVDACNQVGPHQNTHPTRDERHAYIFKKDCLAMIEVLKNNDLVPVLVFDGNATPLKTHIKELTAAITDAKNKKCTVVFPKYKEPQFRYVPDFPKTIDWMRDEIEVEFIVAPYEADAQLAYLETTGYVQAVLTKDADLIAFGCEKILYNTDFKNATCDYYNFTRLTEKNNKYKTFTKKMLLEMLIMVGCDYFPNLAGKGIEKAHELIQKHRTYKEVIRMENLKLTNGDGKTYDTISKIKILEHFEMAILAFKFQQVYVPASETCSRLSQLEGYDGLQLEMVKTINTFLGPYLKKESVCKIAKGDSDSIIKKTDIDTKPEDVTDLLKKQAVNGLPTRLNFNKRAPRTQEGGGERQEATKKAKG